MAAFMKLGDVKGEFQADELTGTSDSFFGDEIHLQVDGLNETTNFRPTKRASAGIVHPDFKTGYDTDPVDSLSETFGDGDPRILGPISGEGVFKPQDIDTRGSVIVGDNHFKPGRGGDSLTGEGRPTKIWTTGGTSEDKLDVGPVNKTADTGWGAVDWRDLDVVIGNGVVLDTEAPSMSMHQGAMNSVWAPEAAGNFRDAAGNMTDTSDSFVSTGQPVEAPLMHQDTLTGDGRPTNSWRNADPSPFEDRHAGDYDANDAVFGMRQNISGNAGPGGSTFMTGIQNFDVVAHGVMPDISTSM